MQSKLTFSAKLLKTSDQNAFIVYPYTLLGPYLDQYQIYSRQYLRNHMIAYKNNVTSNCSKFKRMLSEVFIRNKKFPEVLHSTLLDAQRMISVPCSSLPCSQHPCVRLGEICFQFRSMHKRRGTKKLQNMHDADEQTPLHTTILSLLVKTINSHLVFVFFRLEVCALCDR